MGPNLLAFLTSVWGKAVSVGNVTTLLNDTFGAGLCKTVVTHALVAASGRLQKTAGEINASLSESRYIKMDETPIRFNGKRQYVWACIDYEGVAVTIGTHSAAEIDCHFIVKFRCKNTTGQLAKIIADNKKKDSVIEEQVRMEEGKKTTAELIMKTFRYAREASGDLRERSFSSVPQQRTAQQKKARSAKGTSLSPRWRLPPQTIKGGRQTTGRDKCSKCGGASLSDVRTTAKQMVLVWDPLYIPQMPKATVVTHVSHQCVCSDCETVTIPKLPGISGTSLGPNLLAFLTSVWGKAVSVGNVTTLLNDTFGAGLCKTVVTPTGSRFRQAAKDGRRDGVPFRITIHQDGRDAHQVQRKTTVRVGMHLG